MDGGRARLAARRDRSHGHADGRPAAARLAAPPARRARARSAIGSTPSKSSRSDDRARQGCARRSRSIQDLERLIVARRARRPPGRAISWRCGIAGRRAARSRCCSTSARRRSCAACVGELDDLRRRARLDRAGDRRRAAGAGARRRLRPRRRRPGARRAAAHQPLGQAGDRRDGRARARAHRHQLAEGRASTASSATTSRSRSRTCTRCRPTIIRKQTIAGGERFITPALKEYEEKVLGADERIVERELELFEALRAARRRRSAARARHRARLAALDVLAALAETATVCNYTKPHVHDGDEIVGDRRAASGRRAAGRRRVRAERHPAQRHDAPAGDPHRARTWAASRPTCGRSALLCLLAQAGSFVPAREAKLGARRSHLRARRRVRQHRARPVDVHGRDAGDGEDPAAARRRAAWSCSTRSAAARRPSTA